MQNNNWKQTKVGSIYAWSGTFVSLLVPFMLYPPFGMSPSPGLPPPPQKLPSLLGYRLNIGPVCTPGSMRNVPNTDVAVEIAFIKKRRGGEAPPLLTARDEIVLKYSQRVSPTSSGSTAEEELSP